MEIKTSNLIGPALDWAVEQIVQCGERSFSPTTNWTQGGPIIERMFAEGLEMRQGEPTAGNQRAWARLRDGRYYSACTPLIAAMRCFVASKLGDEVNVPEELV